MTQELATQQLLCGWGRANPTMASVARPLGRDEIRSLLDRASAQRCGQLIPRGLGRSYGDAAQRAGGTVIDCTRLNAVLDFDERRGVLRAEAGISFDAVLREVVPRGFFVPVTPGTRFVTLGGAIASDVHGKNHHVDGSLTEYVEDLTIETPIGPASASPAQNPEEFWATCGGMGLTGIITEAVLRLVPIETSQITVDTVPVANLDACLEALSDEKGRYPYSVAWIDALATGTKLGRGILSRGHHTTRDELEPSRNRDPLAYDPSQRAKVPLAMSRSLLTPRSIAAFNEFWFRVAGRRRTSIESITQFFHPLDAIGDWNTLYGRRGFTQYQFVVPFGSESVISSALEQMSAARVASFLTVLKRFGRASKGHLSFPIEGWTLALDLPLGTPGLPDLLDRLDEEVVAVGGRVYLSKDGRVRHELIGEMYRRLAEWQVVRSRLDPKGVLASDLGVRLGLSPDRPQSMAVAQ